MEEGRGTVVYGIRITHDKSITVRFIDARVNGSDDNGSGTGAPVASRIPDREDDGWSGELRIVSFKVEDYVVAALDRLAEQLNTSRSELIRLGVLLILALFSDRGEVEKLLGKLEELESKVNSIEEDVEWLKGVVHDRVGPW